MTSQHSFDSVRGEQRATADRPQSAPASDIVQARLSHRSRVGQADDIRGAMAVQRAGGGEDSDAVHAAAARGTAGSGGALPHLDAIQRSFGHHDVSGVQAHVGGKATEASAAMGAEAYATGDDVAFARAPDLHTAAHEAAHVVQQRGGVSLKGGVGQAGDPYERHADAVADRVVQGESAADLLDQMADGAKGGHGGSPRAALQRKGDEPSDTPPEIEPGPPTPNQYGRVGHVEPYLALRVQPDPQPIDDDNRGELEVAQLHFDDRVRVLGEVEGDWLHLRTDDGAEGYAARFHIFRNPPEPQSRLYQTKSGDTALAIAMKHFSCGDWGADGRFFTNVLVYVNGGDGNPKKGIYKSKSGGSWKNTEVKADHYIWLPEPTFARSLQGVVDSGSITYEIFGTARDITAFAAGLVTGLWDGIVDALVGLADLVGLVWDAVSSLVQGTLLADLKAFWEQLKALDIGALLDAFAERWNNPDPWEKYKFRGWVVGFAIMLVVIELLLAAVTGGAGNAARWGTKIAKLTKLDKLVDALRGTKAVQNLAKGVDKVADAAKGKLDDLKQVLKSGDGPKKGKGDLDALPDGDAKTGQSGGEKSLDAEPGKDVELEKQTSKERDLDKAGKVDAGLERTGEIRAALDVGKKRTIAVADVDITGGVDLSGEIVSFSGGAGKGGLEKRFLDLNPGSQVAGNTARKGPGRLDAEVKILDTLAAKLDKAPNAKGKIHLFVDQPAGKGICKNCLDAIKQFEQRFPGIEIIPLTN